MNFEEELTAVYSRQFDPWVNLYTMSCGGDVMAAEDIIQTAFLRALIYKDSFDCDVDDVDMEKWVSSIVHYVCKSNRTDYLNITTPLEEDIEIDELAANSSPEHTVITGELVGIINAEIQRKNGMTQTILYDHLVLGFSVSDISSAYNYTQGTCKSLVSRFLKGVRKKYGELYQYNVEEVWV